MTSRSSRPDGRWPGAPAARRRDAATPVKRRGAGRRMATAIAVVLAVAVGIAALSIDGSRADAQRAAASGGEPTSPWPAPTPRPSSTVTWPPTGGWSGATRAGTR